MKELRKQKKKQRAKERAEKDREWRRQKVLTLLKIALSATHTNPEGDLRHMRPTIARCIAILEGKEYVPSANDRPFTREEEEDLVNLKVDS